MRQIYCRRAGIISLLLMVLLISAGSVSAVRMADFTFEVSSSHPKLAWRTFTMGVPSPRSGHTAVWTSSEMIIWGEQGSDDNPLDDGAAYNPSTYTWELLPTLGAPSVRTGHSAVWTGTEMIIWGGRNNSVFDLNTGGRYNPVTHRWTPISTHGAPAARAYHTAVWTGSVMIVWGGIVSDFFQTMVPTTIRSRIAGRHSPYWVLPPVDTSTPLFGQARK